MRDAAQATDFHGAKLVGADQIEDLPSADLNICAASSTV
jgi:hypothetical protein